MIEILEKYKGQVITICLKGASKSVFNGIVDKINLETKILRIQSWKRYIFIDITEIAVIMEDAPGHVTADFNSHTVPNVFA